MDISKIDLQYVYMIGLWAFLLGFFALMLFYIFIEKSKKFIIASLIACLFILVPIYLPKLLHGEQELIEHLRASGLVVGVYGIIATVFNFKIRKRQKEESELSYFGFLCVLLIVFLSAVEFQRTGIERKFNRTVQAERDTTMRTMSDLVGGISDVVGNIPNYQLSRVQKDSLFKVLLEAVQRESTYNRNSNNIIAGYAKTTEGEVKKAGRAITESKKAIIAFDSAAYGLIDRSFEVTNGQVENSKLFIAQKDSILHAQTKEEITASISNMNDSLGEGLDKIDGSLAETKGSLDQMNQVINNLPDLMKREDVREIVKDWIQIERANYLKKIEETIKSYYGENPTASREINTDQDTTKFK